jgi:hypothetical protein
MEDLKQYKEVWKQQEYKNIQVDSDTITKMIHRKSSSIVKWIFYISLIEFVVLTLINIFVKLDKDESELAEVGLTQFMNGISILIGYIIPLIFIYLFYKNYKRISVTSTTKELIHSILKTRKTVKYYIITILGIITFTLLYSTNTILQSPEYSDILADYSNYGKLLVWIIVVFFILIIDGVILLFYLLLYGILIKRLNFNYKELVKE